MFQRTALVSRFLVLFTVLFSLLTISSAAFAGLAEDFATLKNSGTDFTVIGVICEQVAKLELEENYPKNKYTVETGIQYGDGKRAIGELDVIVFENSTGKAIMVGEVKCWRDLGGAHRKATDQRNRFLRYINSNARLEFVNTTTYERYDQERFEGIREFISIAQKGSESAGFTDGLDYTLEELMGLRKDIMACQQGGSCTRPVKHRRGGYFSFGELSYDSNGEAVDFSCTDYLKH